MSPTIRTLIVWIAILMVVIVLWTTFQSGRLQTIPLTFSEFLEHVDAHRVAEVEIRGQEVTGTFKLIKNELRKEGYDPAAIADPLFVLKPGETRYQRLDAAFYAQMRAGTAGY